MVQYSNARLDTSFAALSDATRRGVLEQAGLVTTTKVGRVRTCKLGMRRLEEETAWLEAYRQRWEARFDELDRIIEELRAVASIVPARALSQKEKHNDRKRR